MVKHEFAPEVISQLAAALFPGAPVLELVPLTGGLESSVARLTLRAASGNSRQQIIVKRIANRRELASYRALASSGVTPSLLGSVDHGGSTFLFLERVRPVQAWPWRDSANTRLVVERLAHLHQLPASASHLDEWDYEAELLASGEETIRVATDVAAVLPELDIRRELRRMRRVVSGLSAARRQMHLTTGSTLIHGDVHSGNVMLRNRGGNAEVMLLDWGRSRRGSPLEDVSSWLLSLRSWEPAAARDHDMLFRAYLTAAGRAPLLTDDVRDAYWTAAASNVLAGALRYQLLVAASNVGKVRTTAVAEACSAFRTLRRAAERLPVS